MLRSIELFAGAGGLALGLESAGFTNVMLVEIDKIACSTLKKNRPEWNMVVSDINEVNRTLSNYDLVDIDLVSGGFPCQAFSHAGKRAGINDPRGNLFQSYATFVTGVKPKVVLLENVKGLLTHDNGNTFSTVIETFKSSGYQMFWKLIDTANFGVPQSRERVIMVGVRNDIHASLGDFNVPSGNERHVSVGEALLGVPHSPGAIYPEKKKIIMDMVPEGGNWKSLPEDVAKEYMGGAFLSGGGKTGYAKRLSSKLPSKTILCTPSQKQTERCHPFETRPLTIRESARIQSFPDDWEFCGTMANQYKQIGNAVPPLLASAIGAEIKRYLLK